VNGGVLNTVEGSPSIDNLKILQEKGVEILSCGTCLDYYNVKNKLMVGEISNMYTIVDTLNSAKNTIRI
jgi:intracellular sulfur oxidation DsrE/DsrF family protein